MTSRRWRRRAAVGASAVAALALAACGGDDESGDDASAEQVTVTATEYDFELSATPTAETKEIVFDNAGEEPHALIFTRINEGFTLDEAFELQGRKGSATDIVQVDAAPGKTSTSEVEEEIEPGEYTMLCPIGSNEGPHYKLGQLEEFSIG